MKFMYVDMSAWLLYSCSSMNTWHKSNNYTYHWQEHQTPRRFHCQYVCHGALPAHQLISNCKPQRATCDSTAHASENSGKRSYSWHISVVSIINFAENSMLFSKYGERIEKILTDYRGLRKHAIPCTVQYRQRNTQCNSLINFSSLKLIQDRLRRQYFCRLLKYNLNILYMYSMLIFWACMEHLQTYCLKVKQRLSVPLPSTFAVWQSIISLGLWRDPGRKQKKAKLKALLKTRLIWAANINLSDAKRSRESWRSIS